MREWEKQIMLELYTINETCVSGLVDEAIVLRNKGLPSFFALGVAPSTFKTEQGKNFLFAILPNKLDNE